MQLGTEFLEYLGGDALSLADQAEQDVLRADVVVAQLQGFAQREFEHLLGPGSERDMPRRRLRSLADDLDDLGTNGFEVDSEALESSGRDAFTLVDQPEQDVLGADVIVIEQTGLFLRKDDDPAGPVGEPLEHVISPHKTWRPGFPNASVSIARGHLKQRSGFSGRLRHLSSFSADSAACEEKQLSARAYAREEPIQDLGPRT